MVMLLAGGVSVIVTNTQALGTILPATEQLVTATWAGAFAVAARLVNIPLPFLMPSSSGHAALLILLLSSAHPTGEDRGQAVDHKLDGDGDKDQAEYACSQIQGQLADESADEGTDQQNQVQQPQDPDDSKRQPKIDPLRQPNFDPLEF